MKWTGALPSHLSSRAEGGIQIGNLARLEQTSLNGRREIPWPSRPSGPLCILCHAPGADCNSRSNFFLIRPSITTRTAFAGGLECRQGHPEAFFGQSPDVPYRAQIAIAAISIGEAPLPHDSAGPRVRRGRAHRRRQGCRCPGPLLEAAQSVPRQGRSGPWTCRGTISRRPYWSSTTSSSSSCSMRSSLAPRALPRGDRAAGEAGVKGARWLLLKNPENLGEERKSVQPQDRRRRGRRRAHRAIPSKSPCAKTGSKRQSGMPSSCWTTGSGAPKSQAFACSNASQRAWPRTAIRILTQALAAVKSLFRFAVLFGFLESNPAAPRNPPARIRSSLGGIGVATPLHLVSSCARHTTCSTCGTPEEILLKPFRPKRPKISH